MRDVAIRVRRVTEWAKRGCPNSAPACIGQSLDQPPSTTSTVPGPLRLGQTTGFLGGNALANALGVHESRRDAFFKRLERGRNEMELADNDWHEIKHPQRNSPRFMYRASGPRSEKWPRTINGRDRPDKLVGPLSPQNFSPRNSAQIAVIVSGLTFVGPLSFCNTSLLLLTETSRGAIRTPR